MMTNLLPCLFTAKLPRLTFLLWTKLKVKRKLVDALVHALCGSTTSFMQLNITLLAYKRLERSLVVFALTIISFCLPDV
jgi:hypothetical protein